MADWSRLYVLNDIPLGDSEYQGIEKLDNELDRVYTLLNTLRVTFTMEDQASDVTTAANTMALYSKSVGGDSEAFLRGESNATALQVTQDAGVRLRGAGVGGPLTVTQNSQTVGLSHNGTDAGLDLNKGDLIVQTSEGTNTTTDIIIKGKGTEGGTVAVKGPSDTDYLKLSHDGTNANINTDDGSFVFQTDEGTNTDTVVESKGKGVAKGIFRLWDDSATNYIDIDTADAIGANRTFPLPSDAPADGEVITYDGATSRSKWAAATAAPRGYISGFDYSMKDADELTFVGGIVEIDGTTYTLDAALDVDMDARLGGAFGASTWYAIYIDPPDSGTTLAAADFETKALGGADDPAWDYAKVGWYHPTNTDWRCIGFYYTGAGSTIQECYTSGGWFNFVTPLIFLDTGAGALTTTAVDTLTPDLGINWLVYMQTYQYDTGNGAFVLQNGDDSSIRSLTNYQLWHDYGAGRYSGSNALLITDTSGNVNYSHNGSPSTIKMWLRGFRLPRGM